MTRKPSDETNKLLAASLKKCMQSTPIGKISIKQITDGCGLNRQTFYYHFKDIYDLVHWMFLRDLKTALEEAEKLEANDWETALRFALEKLDENRDYYMAIYACSNYPQLRQDFIEYTSEMLLSRLKPQFDERGFDDFYRGYLARLYGLVLFEFAEKWQRGYSFSTMEQFIASFSCAYNEQMNGALETAKTGVLNKVPF